VTSACPAIVVATVKRWFHPTEHDDDRWRGGRYNEAELLNLLPFALAKKMRDHMYRQLVLNVPLFRGLQDQAMDRLVNLLRPFLAMKGQLIYREGDIGNELFIIADGRVRLQREEITLATLDSGSFFGEQAIFFQHGDGHNGGKAPTFHLRRRQSARALVRSKLNFVTRQDLFMLSKEFPYRPRVTSMAIGTLDWLRFTYVFDIELPH
jgi:hypothetical protein